MKHVHWRPTIFGNHPAGKVAIDFNVTNEPAQMTKLFHSHPEHYEISVYVSGENKFCFEDGNDYVPSYGDIRVSAPGQPHCGVLAQACCLSRINLFLCVDAEQEFIANGFDITAACREIAAQKPSVIRLPDHLLHQMMKMFFETNDALDRKLIDCDAIAYSCFIRFFTIINNAYFSSNKSIIKPYPTGVISAACQYIDDHYYEINNLTEVSEALHVSSSYLSSGFSSKMKITMTDYLHYRRLSRSLYLLATGKSVTEAALEVGFSSASYYSKLFHHRYGISPSQYAKQITC